MATDTVTPEQIEQIPRVYRDFLLALKPVIDSESMPVRISGIPRGRIHSLLMMRGYDLDEGKFDYLIDELGGAGLIEQDRLGFFWPTGKGTRWIRALFGPTVPESYPPLPPFLKD